MRPPAYVSRYLQAGESCSFENGSWYIVVRKSHRVKGKRNPVASIERVAKVTYEGRCDLNTPKEFLQVTSLQCYEFGFSYVLSQQISPNWLNTFKEDAPAIFREVIRRESPRSYLLLTENPRPFKVQNLKLQSERFWTYHEPDLRNNLQGLKTLHMFSDGVSKMIECPSEEHYKLLNFYNINIKECTV